jgi:hypothetical protein
MIGRRALQLVFLSRRGWRLSILHALAAFGLLSALLQLVSAIWAPEGGFPYPWWIAAAVLMISVAYGVVRAWPRRHIVRLFVRPDMTVRVTIGDLFDQDAHLVVGASDTFDTDTSENLIINSTSVIGQFVQRVYGGDRDRLDRELVTALRDVEPASLEPVDAKPGKRERYPLGTVAVLGSPSKRTFAVAYTRMGNDLIARGSVDDLWRALGGVWNAMHLHGQRGTIAVPLIGSEFARITCLDKESLLKMLLLSFVARSRQDPVCRGLVVVIHPDDYDKINMLEVAAYLRTL